jgi:hypothetical protein
MFKLLNKVSPAQTDHAGQQHFATSRKFYLAAGATELVTCTIGMMNGHMNSMVAFAVTYIAFASLIDELMGISIAAIPRDNIKMQNHLKNISNGVGAVAGLVCTGLGAHQENSALAAMGLCFAGGAAIELLPEGKLLPGVRRRAGETIGHVARRAMRAEAHNFFHDPTKPAAIMNAAGFLLMPKVLAGLPNIQIAAIMTLGLLGAAYEWQSDGLQPEPS